MNKKLISILLITLMLVMLLPPAVFAATTYGLWVDGVQVTSANKDDIFNDGGRAVFNASTHTLTLKDISLGSGYKLDPRDG